MTMLPATARGLILDMDGVLWKDTVSIGDLPRIFARFKELNLAVALATNNSTRTVDQYVEKLRGFGVMVEPWQVVTSSLAVAHLMLQRLPEGTPVFAIGEQGLTDALKAVNFDVLPVEKAEKAEAVVIGIDKLVNFEKMCAATLLVRAGKPFFATNPDKTFPTPRGQIPGAGAWTAVIVTATGIEPEIAGKPFPYLLELSLERLGTPKENTYVVGDRLETDIAGGQALGAPSVLVLSGVSSFAAAQAWTPKIDIIAEDLATLVGA